MTISEISAVMGLIEIAVGVPYAIFGKSVISVNGREPPPLFSFSVRLLFPFLVLGLAGFAAASAYTDTATKKSR